MRILILSTSDNGGGAAVAARRLAHALAGCGHEARMLVRDKTTGDPLVTAVGGGRWTKAADRARLFLANGMTTDKLWQTDGAYCGCSVTGHPLFAWADVVNLHWVNQGFLSIAEIGRIMQSGKRIVWTLHDLWPLMGACHHPGDCRLFESQCRNCPQLCRPSSHDLAATLFGRKRAVYAAARDLTFVAVSRWTARMAQRSALLQGHRVEVLHNVINTDVAMPTCRKQPTILFGAARIDHAIKGFGYLVDALHHLVRRHPGLASTVRLATFGDNRDPRLFDAVPIAHTHLGVLSAEALAEAYDKAAIVVSSSLCETFGQTLIEGALHGCVPVAFGGSGPDDIIDHQANGYLARHLDTADLAEGLAQALAHQAEWGAAAREKVQGSFSQEAVGKAFEFILDNHR